MKSLRLELRLENMRLGDSRLADCYHETKEGGERKNDLEEVMGLKIITFVPSLLELRKKTKASSLETKEATD